MLAVRVHAPVMRKWVVKVQLLIMQCFGIFSNVSAQ